MARFVFYLGFKEVERIVSLSLLEELFEWVDNNISPDNAFAERRELFNEFSRRIKEIEEGEMK
jgi:hypothetical protein